MTFNNFLKTKTAFDNRHFSYLGGKLWAEFDGIRWSSIHGSLYDVGIGRGLDVNDVNIAVVEHAIWTYACKKRMRLK